MAFQMTDSTAPADPPPDQAPAWRAGVDADRRKRRRRFSDGRATLRRMTVTAAVVATGLDVVLFAQTGIGWAGPDAVQASIVSFINVFLPGAVLQPPSSPPSPAPSSRPVVTTGGS
jgi:hypothetical protein